MINVLRFVTPNSEENSRIAVPLRFVDAKKKIVTQLINGFVIGNYDLVRAGVCRWKWLGSVVFLSVSEEADAQLQFIHRLTPYMRFQIREPIQGRFADSRNELQELGLLFLRKRSQNVPQCFLV